MTLKPLNIYDEIKHDWRNLRFNRLCQPWRKYRIGINSELGLIRIENLVSGWFGLLPLGLNRIRSDRFFYRFSLNELQNVFQSGSGRFTFARIQISE